MISLSNKNFFATGTVREPRLIDSALEDSKLLAKKERGSYSTVFDTVNKIVAVKWSDNAVVTLASNFDVVEPCNQVRRFNRKERQQVTVTQPKLISAYNASMGGVDSLDNFVSAYRISVKAKKWWWPYFVNYIDICLTNAWRIHRLIHTTKMSQLDFRRRVAMSLMCTVEPDDLQPTSSHGPGRDNKLKRFPYMKSINIGHMVVENPDKKRLRCRSCKSVTIYSCSKCNVGLHPKCFSAYHAVDTE